MIQKIKTISNRVSHTIELWLDNVLGGYVTKCSIDFTHSYSAAEIEFFKESHGRYLKSMYMLIKMLLCDKNIMRMEFDR